MWSQKNEFPTITVIFGHFNYRHYWYISPTNLSEYGGNIYVILYYIYIIGRFMRGEI